MAERRTELILVLGLAVVTLAGCATAPGSDETYSERRAVLTGSGTEPRPQTMNPASASLLQQAAEQRRGGNVAQAAATLERAVRIDPGEPAVWLALAQVRYAEGNWQQAEQLARRARSLAADQSAIDAEARSLLADALDRQGRQQEAADIRSRK